MSIISIRETLLNSIWILFPVLFWVVTMYPAILTPDSYETLNLVIHTEDLNLENANVTPAYFYFIYISSLGGNFLLGSVMAQVSMVLCAIYIWVKIIFNNCPKKFQILICGILFITPFFGPLSMSIWKDVPYIALTMIAMGLLVKPTENNYRVFLAISILAIGALFRFEGFAVLLASGLFSFLVFLIQKLIRKKSLYLKLSIRFILASILSFVLINILQIASNMPPPSDFFKTQSFFLDIEYVNSNFPNTLPKFVKEEIEKISPSPTLVGLNSCSDTQNFFSSDYNKTEAELLAFKVPRYWFNSLTSNSRDAIVKSRLCRTSAFLPILISNVPNSGHWPTIGLAPNFLKPNRPAVIEKLFYPIGWFWTKLWEINGNLIAWPGLHLTFLILVAIIYARNCNRISNSLPPL